MTRGRSIVTGSTLGTITALLVVGVLGVGAVRVLDAQWPPTSPKPSAPPRESRAATPRAAHLAGPTAPTDVADTDWAGATNARIAAAEYAIRPDGAGHFRAANRAQGLVARFEADGVAITHRGSRGAAVRLGFRGFGAASAATPARSSPRPGACRADHALDELGACLRRLELDHGQGVIEWWENREAGLEQGFELASPPSRRPGTDHVELALEVTGARITLNAEGPDAKPRDALFASDHGEALAYSGLVARDRDGTELEAWLETRAPGTLVLHVEDRAAHYPIVIDPVITSSASFVADSDQVDAEFGTSVASAGDVNGDGFGDVIVGAPLFDAGEADEGRVFVFLGSPTGLASSAIWTAEADQVSAHFGAAVASAGDVNGDGFGDVIVGAPLFDAGEADEGRALVYLGTPSGVAATAVFTFDSNQALAHAGFAVASAGDIDADGFSDVVVGVPDYDAGQTDEGRFYVFEGSLAGPVALGAWTGESDQASASAGSAVAAAGDVNADGYADLLVGAPRFDEGQSDEGLAFVYLGSSTGLQASPWSVGSNQAAALFGSSVSTAGDVDGDGFADVLVGAPAFTNGHTGEGAAFVYLGSPSGLAASHAFSVEANQTSASFGSAVASAGDVNGDGFGDVVVGAPDFDAGQVDEGRAFVFLGSGSGLATVAAWTAEADQAAASFGNAVASAGDVNGDGYGDVLVGASGFETGESNEGLAFGYLGGPEALATIASATLEQNQAGAAFGSSLASAGDVNGDGYDDVVVGAYDFDAGQTDEGRAFLYLGSASGLATTAAWSAESNQVSARFGRSVASAGDVNGDGYDDVVVGASFFDGVATDEGRAFLYLGSSSGLATSAAWSAGSARAASKFGDSVGSAGDVNADGYADVIVGAQSYADGQTNEGAAFLYLGSSRGLRMTPGWLVEANKASSSFGSSVASAGDVNGDGFGDVIVGARLFDADQIDEGRAYVYLGAADGLATTAAWTAESDQTSAGFGFSVASAGDVDQDGFGDVIVGAPGYDAGQLNEGRAFVYLGGPLGLATSATWTAESDQPDAAFGASVASAGDVDGDGYGDVVVGAPAYVSAFAEEGRALVYLGGAFGLAPSHVFSATGGQALARLGVVASAGDVNGDGYGDVLVGAAAYSGPESGEGRVLVHLGGGNVGGAARGPRLVLRDGDGGEPIAAGNRLRGRSLTVSLDGSSPFGRTGVAIEVELKSNGAPFDGLGTTVTPFVSGSNATGVAAVVPNTFAALAIGTRFHVRARLRYRASDSRPADRSRWVYASPSGAARGVHVRTSIADADSDGFDAIGFGGTDCDDDEVEINPAATDSGCDGVDADCSGVADEDFVPAATSCGIGACAAVGTTACTSGVLSNSCAVGVPAPDDATCDGVDDDCSGANDEDFVATTTSCGVGACGATGVSSCPSGVLVNSCVPGAAAPSDATCDGIDDDCSGAKDEDFVPAPTSCGVGACASTGVSSCSGGAPASSCVPRAPALVDATCNGVDDDCSGVNDEDFVPVATSCGVGACLAAGTTTCASGSLGNACVAGAPAANDATCDGVDDDCSGFADEDGMCSAVDAGPRDAGAPNDASNDGSLDGALTDSGADAGPTPPAAPGCGCVIAGAPRDAAPSGLALGLMTAVTFLLFLSARGRRSRRRRSLSQPSPAVEPT